MDNTQWDRALMACMTFPSSLDVEEITLEQALARVKPYIVKGQQKGWRIRHPKIKNKWRYAMSDYGRLQLARLALEWTGDDLPPELAAIEPLEARS